METMMKVPDFLRDILGYTEGKDLNEKLVHLIANDLKRRIHLCSDRIVEFETKYGMSFAEFKAAWEAGKIPNRYSHEVERDYMEWESLDDEYELLLAHLRKLKEEFSLAP